MLSRLTRKLRWRWAGVLAAAYLLCALAPGLAFAFGDGVAARCALANVHAVGATPAPAGEAHAHNDHAHHDHGATHAMTGDAAKSSNGMLGKSDKADQMCCGLACLSALPAALLLVSLPDLVAAVEKPLPEQTLAALSPARIYKPPIA